MAKVSEKLTAAFVAKTTKPGLHGDGAGLWLKVSPSTAKNGDGAPTKSWVFRYMISGKARAAGLGDISTFSLKEARERAKQFRQKIADGIDPIAERKATKTALRAEDAKAVTFEQAVERYIADKSPEWKNEGKHGGQFLSTMKTYAFPVIGKLHVRDIATAHVEAIIRPIWTTTNETANRVRGRIERVLDWAKAHELRDGENPARLKGHLDNLLPKRSKVAKVKHHEALPYAEVPAFMDKLRGKSSVSAAALEFLILTAARTTEVRLAEESEIDFDAKVWTIPAGRIKSGREHRIPLCDRAITILRDVKRQPGNKHWFSTGGTKGLSDAAMLQLVRATTGGSKYEKGITTHGFRASFRTWGAEKTGFATDILEAALAHVVGDATVEAYNRGDLLEKRRRLMKAWESYCSSKPAAGGDNVSPLRKVA